MTGRAIAISSAVGAGIATLAVAIWVNTHPAIATSSIAVVVAVATLILARASAGRQRPVAADEVERLRGELDQRVRELTAEADLRDQILSAMTEAVVLVEGTTVTFANDAARAMLGASPGRPLPPVVPTEAGTSSFEVHHPAHRVMRSINVDLGAHTRVVFAQDVTDAKRIEAIRRDFVANASHELKTPIAGIIATAETLPGAIRDDPEAAARFAETLVKEANRLSNLIQDLLDLARLDQPQAERQPTEWSTQIRQAVEDMEPKARARAIEVRSRIADGVFVNGRPQDLAQLARNLLDNAVSYTPEGGTVEVTLEADDVARLTVTDTGIGIPARELPRIFERFYRVDRARGRHTGGTGLGLSIVRHVAESHGGTVRAESELGRGSTFTVELPLAH